MGYIMRRLLSECCVALRMGRHTWLQRMRSSIYRKGSLCSVFPSQIRNRPHGRCASYVAQRYGRLDARTRRDEHRSRHARTEQARPQDHGAYLPLPPLVAEPETVLLTIPILLPARVYVIYVGALCNSGQQALRCCSILSNLAPRPSTQCFTKAHAPSLATLCTTRLRAHERRAPDDLCVFYLSLRLMSERNHRECADGDGDGGVLLSCLLWTLS